MILTDGVHLVSNVSESELHAFARRIGLKRQWYQESRRHPHYDLTTQRAAKRAIDAGALKVPSRYILEAVEAAKAARRGE